MSERFDDFFYDFRLAARGLARRPGFMLVVVLTLAVGVGANTAIYSAVDALLLRSLSFPAPARLMAVALVSPEDGAGPNAGKVDIISDGLCQRRFNADARVAGQVLHLDNKSCEINAVASWPRSHSRSCCSPDRG